jgi:hypothetical protein
MSDEQGSVSEDRWAGGAPPFGAAEVGRSAEPESGAERAERRGRRFSLQWVPLAGGDMNGGHVRVDHTTRRPIGRSITSVIAKSTCLLTQVRKNRTVPETPSPLSG